MCSLVDTYGFTLSGLTQEEREKRERCLERSDSHASTWQKTLARRKKHGTTRRLKELVRRGIPPPLRPELWMTFSGAESLKANYDGDYYSRIAASEYKEVPLDAETFRIFGSNLNTDGLDTVRRIWMKYVKHCGMEFQQCNGLISVISFLVVVMGMEREEDIFWLFTSLMINKIFTQDEHTEFMHWCRVQERVLGALLRRKRPVLAESIEKYVTLRNICDSWFSSFFVTTFPSETAARILDCVFCEGTKVLYRVSLAIMIRNQYTIMSMAHNSNLPKVLSCKLKRMLDANALLDYSFRSIGSMRSVTIARMRKQVEIDLEKEQASDKSNSWSLLTYPTPR